MLHAKVPDTRTRTRHNKMQTEGIFIFNNKAYNIRRTIISSKDQVLKRTATIYNWPYDPLADTKNFHSVTNTINEEYPDNNYKAPSCIFSFDEELDSKN